MNTKNPYATQLRKIAAATGLDGIANEILAVADELDAQSDRAASLVKAAKDLIHNQETGWRAGGMPEATIQTMPYLKPIRAAVALLEAQP